MELKQLFTFAAACSLALSVSAQDRVHYTGTELSNPTCHDGQLSPVVGVHNIQVMRANREHPAPDNGNGWTYNHQSMLAYWNGQFYMHYLSDPSDEHIPPSQTFLMTSKDGYHWTNPVTLFPIYRVPDGYTKPGRTDKAKDLDAIMHQRVGFYVSKSGRLIAMGNYGVALDKKDDPNDGNGIGRVVREIKKDGSFGPIYFIYYNHAFNEKNTSYPYFKRSKDKEFVKACQEILDNPRYRMQWVEEADRNDPLIPLHKEYKAYCDYTLPDGRLVSLWKQEGNGTPPDGDLWVTYSMNKEDMWVSHIPVPVRAHASEHADDDFAGYKDLSELTDWNLYSLQWAPVSLDGKWLVLQDKDLFDYARVERKIPATKELKVSFELMAEQNDKGLLQIEFLDENGIACSRLELTPDGLFRAKGGARFGNLLKYEPGKTYKVEVELSVANRMVIVYVDGKKVGQRMFFAPVPAIERVMFRTGAQRTYPTVDTPADWYGILPNAGEQEPLCTYRIAHFKTASADKDAGAAFLKYKDFKPYVDYFNSMEDENIAQAIQTVRMPINTI